MITCNSILVPVDFSGPSRAAFELACDYADQFGAALHVLHIQHFKREEAEIGGELCVRTYDQLVANTKQRLDHFIGDTTKNCFPITSVITDGAPAEEIVWYARTNQIDLIVIGTHGHSGFKRLVLGSVAEEVVRTATCDVLTAREHCVDRYQSAVQVPNCV